MKDSTARKRIINAINKEPLIKSERDKKRFFDLIYYMYVEAKEEAPELSDTNNLNFVIDFYLYDGEATIKDLLQDR